MSHVAAHEAGQLSVLAQIFALHAGADGTAIARRLIERFGSLRAIYSASLVALSDALGDLGEEGARIAAGIVATRSLADAAAREAFQGEPVDTAGISFRDYLLRRLGARREECVLVLFFTEEGLFIAEDFYQGIRRDESRIPIRRAVRRAFDLDARRLVLVHNHPSGSAAPSAEDIRATARFRDILEALEFALDDHCIVGRGAVSSMRSLHML